MNNNNEIRINTINGKQYVCWFEICRKHNGLVNFSLGLPDGARGQLAFVEFKNNGADKIVHLNNIPHIIHNDMTQIPLDYYENTFCPLLANLAG